LKLCDHLNEIKFLWAKALMIKLISSLSCLESKTSP
jgi:hypothetical protein